MFLPFLSDSCAFGLYIIIFTFKSLLLLYLINKEYLMKWYHLSAMTITYGYSSESLTKEAVADSS